MALNFLIIDERGFAGNLNGVAGNEAYSKKDANQLSLLR
jgi:hypothetical protein